MGVLSLLGTGSSGAGGSPPFSPLDIAGMAAWFDASDAASIASSAGAVSQWNDKSGNARHATQATAGKKPLTGTRTINAQNVVDFDGVDDYMSFANPSLAQPYTVFVVLQADVTSGDHRVTGTGASLLYQTGGTWNYHSGDTVSWGIAVNTSAHVLEYVMNAASSSNAVDGTAGTPGNPNINTISAAVGVGGAADLGNYHDGAIAELLYFAGALSAGDRTSMRNYLKGKWGTP